MFRSQDIPARLFAGFRGGEYNALGDYYQVLQSNAMRGSKPICRRTKRSRSRRPVPTSVPWAVVRPDPTPGSDIIRARQLQQGWMDVVDDVLDYASTVWTDYILGLTAKRQRESIYEPVANRASPETRASLFERLRGVRQRLQRGVQAVSPWLGILAAGLTGRPGLVLAAPAAAASAGPRRVAVAVADKAAKVGQASEPFRSRPSNSIGGWKPRWADWD